jgi:hypothetical protein
LRRKPSGQGAKQEGDDQTLLHLAALWFLSEIIGSDFEAVNECQLQLWAEARQIDRTFRNMEPKEMRRLERTPTQPL